MSTTVYTYNDKVLVNSANDKWLKKKEAAPVIPANTVRVRTNNGQAPVKSSSATYETATLVEGTSDVYDVYKSGTSFSKLLYQSSNIVEVLGANTSGVTNMQEMFWNCSSLATVALFDTSSVTTMNQMFRYCASLSTVPLFNTSSVTSVSSMFDNCTNVESGALALYNQLSSQTVPPRYYNNTFYKCGSNTVTGAAELAQIPSSWGGTGA